MSKIFRKGDYPTGTTLLCMHSDGACYTVGKVYEVLSDGLLADNTGGCSRTISKFDVVEITAQCDMLGGKGLCPPTMDVDKILAQAAANGRRGAAALDGFGDIMDIAAQRKATPVYSGVLAYFPLALQAVAQCSKAGNDQHNPGESLHWAREKSGDELDALTRHLLDAGTVDTDGIRHSTKVAWRALANLEKELEKANDLSS